MAGWQSRIYGIHKSVSKLKHTTVDMDMQIVSKRETIVVSGTKLLISDNLRNRAPPNTVSHSPRPHASPIPISAVER